MQRKRRHCAALLLLALLLAGCWDQAELEDRGYVVLLGIDRGDRGGLKVSAELARTAALGAGQTGALAQANAGMAINHMTAQAKTLAEAVHMLNGVSPRRLDLRHLRAVVVGEALARDAGVEPYLMELVRSPESRGTVLLAQARGKAEDVLKVLYPVGEVNPARMVEGLIIQARYMHLSPPVRLQHFLIRLTLSGGDPIMPVLAISQASAEKSPEGPGDESALPGKLHVTGPNHVEFIGTAIYRRDRLVGMLNVDETQMLLAMRGEMGKAYFTFPDPEAPGAWVSLRFHQENLPQHRAYFDQGHPRISTRLLFEGEVLSIPERVDYSKPQHRPVLEEAASTFATNTIDQLVSKLIGWDADPIGFGLKFRRKFLSLGAWESFDWRERIPDLMVQVAVQMRIRRYGLILGPDRVHIVR